MRYNQIRECDIANGEGIGIALFVQGCHFKCKGCFNPETWDFNEGKEWTPEVKKNFLELASRPYIKRISLLGGECLADENLDGILDLVHEIRLLLPDKTIWLYTGYDVQDLLFKDYEPYEENYFDYLRQVIISKCDVVVDGRYIDSLRDVNAKWRGSSNQRVIDMKRTLEQDKVVLYCD